MLLRFDPFELNILSRFFQTLILISATFIYVLTRRLDRLDSSRAFSSKPIPLSKYMTRKNTALSRIAQALLAAGFFLPHVVLAQVTLNFVNADIDQVAKAIGIATGQTIIVDPRVKGQLNLVSEQPVADDKAIKTLQSALRMQGYALLQDHGVLKVVPEADAKLQGVPTYLGNTPTAAGDQVITQVFQLHYESANNLLSVLRPLISPNNAIAAYPANNTLVVTDYADNVRRIASIIAGVDVAAGQTADVVPLKNANAPDLAAEVTKILDPGSIGGTDSTLKITILPETRTNSLVIRASSAARLREAEALIAKLDTSTREPGNIHVVALHNADATALAKTLRGMMGQSTGNDSSSSSSKNDFNQNNGGMSSSSGSSSGGSSSGSQSSGSVPPLPSNYGSGGGSSGGGGGDSNSFGSGEAKDSSDSSTHNGMNIQPDVATNSLVITASEPVYRNLRNVIDQLDARRAQVYIESLIVELSSDKAAQLGVQWQGLLSLGSNTSVYGGSNFATTTSQGIVNLTATGYAAGANGAAATAASTLLNNGLNIGLLHQFGKYLGLGALLQALQTSTDVNVLSTPNLITLDNEDAKVVVGQNVPIVTGSYAQTGTTTSVTPFQTYDRQDVGITLHVRPQITAGGTIKLQIYEESSSVVAGTGSATTGPTINKRSIQSSVLADDGSIVVLGGLIQDQYTNANSKVPWLGSLPVVGALFRTENKDRTKTDLMVFLRPVIIRDSDTEQHISTDRYNYIRGETNGYQSDNQNIRDEKIPALAPVSASGTATGGAPSNGVGLLVPSEESIKAQPATKPATPASAPSAASQPAGPAGAASGATGTQQ
jgi:general secretion pathway protein D